MVIRDKLAAGLRVRQIAEASGLGRKTVTAIVETNPLRD